MATGIDKTTSTPGYESTYQPANTTSASSNSQLPSPFDATLASLKQVDADKNGLTLGDLAKLKFDYEASSAAGNLEDLAFLNLIGDVIGTVHPQSFDMEAAEAFIAKYDSDGSGALEDAELQAAVSAYSSSNGEASSEASSGTSTSNTPASEAPKGPAPSVTGDASSGTGTTGATGSSAAEEPADFPFTLADLDTDGSGIIEQDEMEAFVNFTDEVSGNAGTDGTIDLTKTSSGSTGETGSGSASSSETTPTSAQPSSGSSANAGITGAEFIQMYDIDGKDGLDANEVSQITETNNTIIQTLSQADKDGDGALSTEEFKVLANTEIGQQLAAAGYTEITAEALAPLLQSLQINNEILKSADINNDGLITAEEVDVLLADLNSAAGTSTGGSSSGSTTAPEATAGGSSSGSTTTPEATAGGSSSGSTTAPEATAGGSSSGSTAAPEATAGGSSSGSTTAPEATAGGSSSSSATAPEATGASDASGTSRASVIMGTYDTDNNNELTAEEIQSGIDINTANIKAFKDADTDGKAGLSAEEIKASKTLSGFFGTETGITELSAEDVATLTSLIEEENTLLEGLQKSATTKPLTVADLESYLPKETASSASTPAEPTSTSGGTTTSPSGTAAV